MSSAGSWGRAALGFALLAGVLLGACSDGGGDSPADHPEIERVVSAAEAGDVAALVDLVAYEQIGCVETQEGIGAPPLCEGGEAAGDLVDVLPAAQCEGHYLRPAQVRPSFEAFVNGTVEFYAAYRLAEGNFPPGEAAVVFERLPEQGPQPRGGAIYLRGERISGIDHGCSGDAGQLVEFFGWDEAIIAPAE